ncbi:MAG: DUF2027 domain-containing protein [Bacteroidaceae bacterium]|jgi:hypothetical protein|nr:DUF2027 domain-containing protein [Bacteroidaceae bacterium]
MKIGDKVRFLSESGGGIVKGFQGRNVVLVEDEDGFDIPMPIDECVVIVTDDYNIAKVHTVTKAPEKQEQKNVTKKEAVTVASVSKALAINDEQESEVEIDPADKPITFRPKPQERKEGDKLNAFLAFVPVNSREISTTTFECYIVNDCNYFIYYTYSTAENASWNLRSSGIVEPNTKVFVEELHHTDLNTLEKVAIQMVAYKEDKPFGMKQPVSVVMRIDGTKFFKLHSFKESLFFDELALLYEIVKDDVVTRPLVIDAAEMKRSMYGGGKSEVREERPHTADARVRNVLPSQGRSTTQADVIASPASVFERVKQIGKSVIVEVDLHINELLDSVSGMSTGDMKEYQLNVFRKVMEAHKTEKGRKIVFIHGKGDGILRNSIITELKSKYKNCTYQDASFREYGFGATMVIVH